MHIHNIILFKISYPKFDDQRVHDTSDDRDKVENIPRIFKKILKTISLSKQHVWVRHILCVYDELLLNFNNYYNY